MSTVTVTGCVVGNGEGSVAAAAVASSALTMPHRHRLPVFLVSDIKVGLILLAQRTAKRLDALRCARGPQAPESFESYSTLRRPVGWLHYRVGHIFANLPPQRRTDAG
jgi:hypothetical protein